MQTPETKNISMFPAISRGPNPNGESNPSIGSIQPLPPSQRSENGSGSSQNQTRARLAIESERLALTPQ